MKRQRNGSEKRSNWTEMVTKSNGMIARTTKYGDITNVN